MACRIHMSFPIEIDTYATWASSFPNQIDRMQGIKSPFPIEIEFSNIPLDSDRSRRKMEMPFQIEIKGNARFVFSRKSQIPINHKTHLSSLRSPVVIHGAACRVRQSRTPSMGMAWQKERKLIHHISPLPGRAAPSDRLPCAWKHLQVATGRIANGSAVRAAPHRVPLSPFLLAFFLNY